jgi:hypothetical protein
MDQEAGQLYSHDPWAGGGTAAAGGRAATRAAVESLEPETGRPDLDEGRTGTSEQLV